MKRDAGAWRCSALPRPSFPAARGPRLRARRRAIPTLWLLLFCGAFFSATGCDNRFDPVAPSPVQYSIFGYLDAAADTQWIRVMPIRPLATTQPGELGATVELEDLETGLSVELRDSLFWFPDTVGVGSGGVYAHNFWTTARIQPGHSYRLTVRRAGEEPAVGEVEVPGDYGVSMSLQTNAAVRDYLAVSGVPHVAFVASTTRYFDQCGRNVERQSFTVPVQGGPVGVQKLVVGRSGCGTPVIESRQLWVTASGAAWPFTDNSTWGVGAPLQSSNISNAVGFIGGVLTKRIPYENCEWRPASSAYCDVVYDAAAGTLRGSVREVRCGRGPVDTARVELIEATPDANGWRRLRWTLATRDDGEFEFGGLEAGRLYVLSARPATGRDISGRTFPRYGAPAPDTLQLVAGQRLERVIGLSQLNECWMDP